MPTRLDLLKTEQASVKNLRTVAFDLKENLASYYQREIAAIEEYGASNNTVTVKENDVNYAFSLIGETVYELWADSVVVQATPYVVGSVLVKKNEDTESLSCQLCDLDDDYLCDLTMLEVWSESESGRPVFHSLSRDAALDAYTKRMKGE